MQTDPGRHERMVAMYRRGVSIGEIASQFSVQPPAVRRVIVAAGLNLAKVRPLADWKGELAEYVANGGTISGFSIVNGRSSNWAFAIWKLIRADLGAQAR